MVNANVNYVVPFIPQVRKCDLVGTQLEGSDMRVKQVHKCLHRRNDSATLVMWNHVPRHKQEKLRRSVVGSMFFVGCELSTKSSP